MPDGRVRGIVLGGDELYIFVSQAEVVDGFLDEVGVLVSDVAELSSGDTDEQHSVAGVTVAGRLQPCVVGMAIDLFFERIQDAQPRIGSNACAGDRHKVHEGQIFRGQLGLSFYFLIF